MRIATLVSLLFLAPSAWAYLDPSTGSMILSAIVGIFATVALAVKTYWYRLKGFVRRQRKPAGAPVRGDQRDHPDPDRREPAGD